MQPNCQSDCEYTFLGEDCSPSVIYLEPLPYHLLDNWVVVAAELLSCSRVTAMAVLEADRIHHHSEVDTRNCMQYEVHREAAEMVVHKGSQVLLQGKLCKSNFDMVVYRS